MKLGISSYTYTWAVGVKDHLPRQPLTWRDLLNKAAELGVKLVQMADNLPLHSLTVNQLNDLSEFAVLKGIELEAGANGLTSENIELYLNISEKMNSRILRFVIDGPGYKPTPEEVISILKNAESDLQKHKIIIAIENHDRFLASQFLQIVDKVNSPFVGICLDCANSFGAGEGFKEVVNCLAPYVVNLHLKEISINRKDHKMGFDIVGKPFGEGCLPLEWILSKLTLKCRTAILELWTPPEKNIERTIEKENKWALASIAHLRKYIED